MSKRNAPTLQANLEALAAVQPELAGRIAAADRDPELTAQRNRDGSDGIAFTPRQARSARAIHSRYRPRDEADRIVATLDEAATLVVFGMGALFVPQAYTERYPESCCVVVERSDATVRSVLEAVDAVALFSGGGVYIATTASDLQRLLPEVHNPAIRDGVATYYRDPWASWEPQRRYFAEIASVIPAALDEIADEYATMRRFGRAWLAHTVENTFRIDWHRVPADAARLRERIASRGVTIGAAGPTLDDWFETAAKNRTEATDGAATTIVVDTAVPAFAARDKRADIVVSIDAQGWSVLHFRGGAIADFRCVDAGVAPALVGGGHEIPLASAHPLHQLLVDAGLPLLSIGSARNVADIAVRLARAGGAERLSAVGADFSYPHGKTYARGTYHYSVFDRRASRLQPVETRFAASVYRSSTAQRDRETERPIFNSPALDGAAQRFMALIDESHGDDEAFAAVSERSETSIPAVERVWRDHISALDELISRLPEIARRPTPRLMASIGPDGRAHVPLIAAVVAVAERGAALEENRGGAGAKRGAAGAKRGVTAENRGGAGAKRGAAPPKTPYERLHTTFSAARAFIFSHLCRYSK